MTIYHEVALNYELPGPDINHAATIGQQIMQPYIDAGYCSNQRNLWDWNGNLMPNGQPDGPGIYKARRVWTDQTQAEGCCYQLEQARLNDPIVAQYASIPVVKNDNNYETAPTP